MGGENVMRQRKMCKAANESDLLVVVVQHELVEHGEGPLFLASVLCSFSFEGGIFLGHWPSVGRLVMMLHILYSDHRGKGRQNFSSPAFVRPQAASLQFPKHHDPRRLCTTSASSASESRHPRAFTET